MRKIYLLSPSNKANIISIPTIQFDFFVKSVDFENVDILIFTSKTGVQALNKISKDWQKIPAISVGKKTADEVAKYGGKNIFSSKKFYGDILAYDILNKFSDKKLLYIRPEIVASNLIDILKKHNAQLSEKILYRTVCKEFSEKFYSPIFIVTSPSTLKCLLEKEIPDDSIFVAIGETTFKEIPEKYDRFTAKAQTIESCISLARALRLSY